MNCNVLNKVVSRSSVYEYFSVSPPVLRQLETPPAEGLVSVLELLVSIDVELPGELAEPGGLLRVLARKVRRSV